VGDLVHCPNITTLRDLAAGSLSRDDADRVREHLVLCQQCRGAMRRLEAGDAAPAPSGDLPETARDPESSATSAYEVPTQTTPVPPGCEDPPNLSFLAPTARPDSLGRIAHYEILRILGGGGMGIVLKGFDPKLDRVVAIKLIDSRMASSERARRRFLREARSAAAINHVNVVTIHAVDEEHSMPYLVMECLVGRSLKERIEAGPRLGPQEVMRIGMQIAEGLEAAHLQGVIHRDIKPANIMLLDRGEGVKITDFGLARAELDFAEITSAEQVVGTPAYMSPEQVRGEAIDSRSDLFGLGCVLFAMVAGRSPFQGRHILEIGRKITDLEPAPLHLIDPAVPRPLSDLVGRLLQKARDDRPATAGEVAAMLRRLLDDPDLEISIGTTVAAQPAKRSVTRESPRSRVSRWVAAGVVLVLAALALASLVLTKRGMAGRSGDTETVPRRPTTGSVVRVGPGPDADFRTLPQALAFVTRPGTMIRLTEPGVYRGAVRIEEPDRFRGLTIVGGPGVVVSAPGRLNVVAKVADIADVTLRDLMIISGVEQFGLEVDGSAEGLRLMNVAFRKVDQDPGRDYWSHVWLSPGAHGTAAAPIRFSNCSFGPWPTGLVLQGDSHRTIAHVTIEGCRFEARLRQLEIIRAAHDIRVVGNLFLSGRDALLVDSLEPDLCRGITIANNSFYRATNWLAVANSSGGVEGIMIVNNALFEPGGLDTPGGNLASLGAAGWRFAGNIAEHEGGESPLASLDRRLDVVSRDPSDPRFLQPPAGSLLATSGLAGDWPAYVGARTPAPDGPTPARAPNRRADQSALQPAP
jgi:serine/threonine-protein kinase